MISDNLPVRNLVCQISEFHKGCVVERRISLWLIWLSTNTTRFHILAIYEEVECAVLDLFTRQMTLKSALND